MICSDLCCHPQSQRQEQAELAARLKLVKGGLRRAEFETLR